MSQESGAELRRIQRSMLRALLSSRIGANKYIEILYVKGRKTCQYPQWSVSPEHRGNVARSVAERYPSLFSPSLNSPLFLYSLLLFFFTPFFFSSVDLARCALNNGISPSPRPHVISDHATPYPVKPSERIRRLQRSIVSNALSALG